MSLLKSALAKPTVWIAIALCLAIADFFAPAELAICAVHALILPIAWRLLHRRHVSLLTATLMVAVVIPGLYHLVSHNYNQTVHEVDGKAAAMSVIDPARVWTTLTLAAAGLFHINLMRARRRRVGLRRDLQQKVRRRTDELRQLNQSLRDEVQRRQTTEHLLDRSETNLQSLIDRMHLQVLRKDRDGTITYANETFCKQLARDPSDVIGKPDSEFYPPELADGYRADDLRVMETGKPVEHVEEHPTPDGGTGYVQVFKAPEFDQSGQCVGIQVIFWDVTEKHRSAIALRDSEARKRALFETAGDAVILSDRDQTVVEANPSAAHLFQIPTEQLVGRPLGDIAQPIVVDHGDPVDWSELAQTERHEMTLQRRDGSQFDSEVTINAIPMGDSQGMAIIVRDVTVQRQAMETLREAKAAAEATSRTKSEFMAGVSHELRTPLGGITGLTDLILDTPLSPRGRQYVDMIRQSGSQLSDVIEDILDFSAIEAGQVQINPQPIDVHAVVSNAFKSIAARAVGKPLELAIRVDPDTPRHVVADPKRIRQIVMNLGGNAIKFTPSGSVTLKLSGDRSATNNEHANICIAVSDTGVGIPADKREAVFEAFERGEEGTTRRFGGTGLGLSISNELARRMGGRIELESKVESGSTFTCHLELPLAETTTTPKRAIDEKVCCLVDTGQLVIDQSIAQILGAYAIPTVTQIPEDATRRLTWIVSPQQIASTHFESMRRSGDQVVWVTRLGEPLSDQAQDQDAILSQPVLPDELIAAAMHSNSSEGDEFDFDLQDDAARQARKIRESQLLLLVDDSPVNQTVIRDQLMTAGFQVDVAPGGAEAITMAGQKDYDCVLMDLQMPDMDGTEATQRLRAMLARQSKSSPPVIALTAHVTDEHRKLCFDAGMNGFITKPVDRDKLVAEIAKQTSDAADSAGTETTSDDRSTNETTGARVVDENETSSESWRQRIQARSGNRPDMLLAICEAFLEEVPDLIQRIRGSVETRDAASLKTASHTLKSCLAYVAEADDVSKAASIESDSDEPENVSRERVEEIERIASHWIGCVQTLRDETANAVG